MWLQKYGVTMLINKTRHRQANCRVVKTHTKNVQYLNLNAFIYDA